MNEKIILCVDDEINVLNALRHELSKVADEVLTATSGKQGLEVLANREVAVVISDMRMPEMDGAQFLHGVLELQPATFRILLTGYSDTDATIAAVNEGEIQRFLQKPWQSQALHLAVSQGLKRFALIQENRRQTDELAERNQLLQELNTTLEQRVKERTQQLLHCEKLSAVGRLAAGIIHEVRNPLTVAVGWIELSLKADDLPPKYQQGLKMASSELYRAVQILDNLRDFSKQKFPMKSSADINDLLNYTLALVSHQFRNKAIEIKKEFASKTNIWADKDQLGQVFLNLVGNAIDAMQDGGTLTVRTRLTSDPHKGEMIEIDIADTGRGIPADKLGQVFEPFFTTKGETGTGLGLPICRGIIEEHNGEISLDSEQDIGTTFHINLPVGGPEDD